MRHLNETTDISILSQFDMRTGYPAVVQKGNVGAKYVYGLQLRGATTTILRGYRGSNINTPILELAGEAGAILKRGNILVKKIIGLWVLNHHTMIQIITEQNKLHV